MRRRLFTILAGLTLLGSGVSYGQTTVTFTGADHDAMVANGGLSQINYGSQNQMSVGYDAGQQVSTVFRSFLQYDLSSIPANAVIVSATLDLHANTVDNTVDHPYYVERVSEASWDESTLTWSNQPEVWTSDKISIPHADLSSTGTHSLDVTDHVQIMVHDSARNYGWRIRLQQESPSSSTGVQYATTDVSNSSKHPKLTVEYILPLEFATTINHCTVGNDDGDFSITLSQGSTTNTTSNIFFYETIRDTTKAGEASLNSVKTTHNVQYDTTTKTVTATGLEPGIYVLRVIDDAYYSAGNDTRFIFYRHILVGREGETTTGVLLPDYRYQENTAIHYDKPTNSSPINRANTNYYTHTSSITLHVNDVPNSRESASLIQYKMDFDSTLEFSQADLRISAFSKFFRGSSSSNETNVSRITSPWEKRVVTWNTRPGIDSTSQVNIPTTTAIGFDNDHTADTISILPFVSYWQEEPDSNYGVEAALVSYNQTQLADRSYRSARKNVHFLELAFTVKEYVATTFNDSTNTGTFIVKAPDGNLPYTYLIDTEPLGTLDSIWGELKDSTFYDSLTFFQGNVNSNGFGFQNLPSGYYHVGVYDNAGVQIMQDSTWLRTDVVLDTGINATLDQSNIITRSSATSSTGQARLYGELISGASWGGVRTKLDELGEFSIGFNRASDALASSDTDFEFGVRVSAQGQLDFIVNNIVSSTSQSVSIGDELDIMKEGADFLVYLNETEIYKGTVTTLEDESISFEGLMKDAVSKIKILNYWGKYKKPSVHVSVDYPACFAKKADVNITKATGVVINSVSAKNNETAVITSGTIDGGTGNASFEDLPIGTYTISINYTDPLFLVSFLVEYQVAVGYVVNWEELDESFVIPLNTIRRGPGVLPDGISSANSDNVTYPTKDNWVQFETTVTHPFIKGSSGIEVFGLRDNSTLDEPYRLATGGLFIPTTSVFNGTDWVTYDVSPDNVWRMEESDGDFSLYVNGTENVGSTVTGTSATFDVSVFQTKLVRYEKTIASFCTFIPDQYVEPKREIEGGYYLVPTDDILRFAFLEEYNLSGNLTYEVTDFSGATIGGLSALSEVYGDNRYELDVSSLTAGYYLLEIENDKGENWFLRFKIQ